MRAAALILGMMMLTVTLSGTAAGEEVDTCAFLIDFGDGRTYWVDVPLHEGMTGYDVFIYATETFGFTETHIEIEPYGHQVMSIDGYSGNYNFSDPNAPYDFWRLLRWSEYDNGWIWTSVLLDGVDPYDTEAIAFIYTRWTYMGPPLSTPFQRDTWISGRNDHSNTGSHLSYTPSSVELGWSKDLGNGAIDAPVAYALGRTYAIASGIDDGNGGYQTDAALFCLDGSGDIIWSTDMGEGHHVAAPMLWNEAIYAPSADGRLFAFDLLTGDLRWSYDTGASPNGITSSPLMYQNLIVVANSNGRVVAVDEGGELEWELTLPTTVASAPAVRNGLILVGGGNGSLYAISGDGGGVEWSLPIGSVISGSPVTMKNRIIVTYSNITGDEPSGGGVASVSYEGDLLWKTPTAHTPGSAAVTPDGAVASSSLGLSMVGFDGTLRWTADLGTTTPGGSPVTVNGMSYLVTNGETSRLVAVDENGTISWTEELQASSLASPSMANSTLFLPSSDGKVYAFTFTDLQPNVQPGPDDGGADDGPPNGDGPNDDGGQSVSPGGFDPYVMGGVAALAVIGVMTAYVYWYKRTNK